MKKPKLLVIVVLMLVLSLVLAATAGASRPPRGDEGCSPGYWKNHLGDPLGGDYYIVKGELEGDYYIVKEVQGDYYIVKLTGDYYIVKQLAEDDYYIIKLGSDYYIVKLLGDYYIVKLGTDYYIVKGTEEPIKVELGMDPPGGTILLRALKARGPGSELARHGAAALLNCLSPDVDYSLTLEEVLGYIVAGDAAPLVEANEQYCPLD